MTRFGSSGILPYLIGLTPVARKVLRGGELPLAAMPFRVGRESREVQEPGWSIGRDRRTRRVNPNNNFYLPEKNPKTFLSREHFLIDRQGKRSYVLIDKGSERGTVVNGVLVGGTGKRKKARLPDRAVLVLGGGKSPYRFRFVLRDLGRKRRV